MSYTEYASQPTGNLRDQGNTITQGDKTVNPSNNRFTCNNTISSTNIEQAIKTYKKLYDIYTTKPGPDCVQDFSSNFDYSQDCNGSACPYQANSESKNAFYIGGVSCTSNNGILSVQDLDVYLDDCGANIRDYNNNNSSTPAYASAEELAKKLDVSYNALWQKRSDLDNKMNELLGNNPNSILYENQNQLDAGVYTTILWTVLVTSSLYYIFTKI